MQRWRVLCLQIHENKYHIDIENEEVQPTTISMWTLIDLAKNTVKENVGSIMIQCDSLLQLS